MRQYLLFMPFYDKASSRFYAHECTLLSVRDLKRLMEHGYGDSSAFMDFITVSVLFLFLLLLNLLTLSHIIVNVPSFCRLCGIEFEPQDGHSFIVAVHCALCSLRPNASFVFIRE